MAPQYDRIRHDLSRPSPSVRQQQQRPRREKANAYGHNPSPAHLLRTTPRSVTLCRTCWLCEHHKHAEAADVPLPSASYANARSWPTFSPHSAHTRLMCADVFPSKFAQSCPNSGETGRSPPKVNKLGPKLTKVGAQFGQNSAKLGPLLEIFRQTCRS